MYAVRSLFQDLCFSLPYQDHLGALRTLIALERARRLPLSPRRPLVTMARQEKVSDSTFSRATSHPAGAALPRQMFAKPPTAVFVLCRSLGNSDNSVICILFHPPPHPPPHPPCQGVKFIFACAQRLIGSGRRRRSNLSPTIGKASPQSRSTQSRLSKAGFPRFPTRDLIQFVRDQICPAYLFICPFICPFEEPHLNGAALKCCCSTVFVLYRTVESVSRACFIPLFLLLGRA